MLLSTLFSEVLFVEFVKREHWDGVSYVSYNCCYVTMVTIEHYSANPRRKILATTDRD